MQLIKKIYRKLPDKLKLFLLSIYDKIYKVAQYQTIHKAVMKKIKRLLQENTVDNIKPFNKSLWKLDPIFTQYYSGYYCGKRVFCKVSEKENYGCIVREANALKYIKENSTVLDRMFARCHMVIQDEEFDIIVTDYLDGVPLDKMVNRLDVKKVYEEMQKMLVEFKRLGIIHMDIRPSNIMYDRNRNEVKVFDLGLTYVKKHKEDCIYKNMCLPEKLTGIGCHRYNPYSDQFDDAYAVLQTLKDVYFDFKKDYKEEWMKLNLMIGAWSIRLSSEKKKQ